MEVQNIILTVALFRLVNAYVAPLAFTGVSVQGWKAAKTPCGIMHMGDSDSDLCNDANIVNMLEKTFNQEDKSQYLEEISNVESSLGMPWKSSIDSELNGNDLLYMPFWEWQMSFMKDHLTDLRVKECTDDEKKYDFSFNENHKKKARIVNMNLSSREYSKIRMTYYDAGNNTQVFNSVWYPDPTYNLPILGIDLLAFNRKKYLAIVDFQPIHEKEEDHASKYENILKPIKDQYEFLKGRMSSKFYDETKFFSQEMLFARFDNENVVSEDLFPAFQSYVDEHVKLVKSTKPNPSATDAVINRHIAYDTYSAERDPATGLFAAMFGGKWANDFVHKFLFSRSERKKESTTEKPVTPFMGGGPPPKKVNEKENVQKERKTELAPSRP